MVGYFYFSDLAPRNDETTNVRPYQSKKRDLASVKWNVVGELGHGESLVVVGDHTALGDGKVENGLSLVTSKEYWYVVSV
jgi:hypothetical protein